MNRVQFPPGSHMVIVLDDATDPRDFSGLSRFLRPCIPALLNTRLASPSSTFNNSTPGDEISRLAFKLVTMSLKLKEHPVSLRDTAELLCLLGKSYREIGLASTLYLIFPIRVGQQRITTGGHHGGVVVRLLAFHQGEQGFIPGVDTPDCSRRCPWSAGFLGDLPFPPPLHSGATPYSPRYTPIGLQDLAVKSRPNLFVPLEQGSARFRRFMAAAPVASQGVIITSTTCKYNTSADLFFCGLDEKGTINPCHPSAKGGLKCSPLSFEKAGTPATSPVDLDEQLHGHFSVGEPYRLFQITSGRSDSCTSVRDKTERSSVRTGLNSTGRSFIYAVQYVKNTRTAWDCLRVGEWKRNEGQRNLTKLLTHDPSSETIN
ncbi:hypothetical protein PR048_025077 [Dryococelus australis]|uniref:Uncharacterized protein n=1 Tax=Dryococelus australis TaxID=614101 RepID=A0ABQ9GQD8_9NEOP|nr:hypothetical protein PR048_025077 [Dryococelus australis]